MLICPPCGRMCRTTRFWKNCFRCSTSPVRRILRDTACRSADVIALKRNGNVSVHYVDSIGFKDLQGFLDKQPERTSVLQNLKEKCDAPECNPTVCRKVRAEHEL